MPNRLVTRAVLAVCLALPAALAGCMAGAGMQDPAAAASAMGMGNEHVFETVMAANRSEIALSQQAEQRAASAEVRAFAARMVAEHTRAATDMAAFGQRMATPWSNVEGIRLIAPGIQGKLGEVPCLVLREPIQTRLWSRARGVPAELKGRVIPIYPNIWERPLTLEEELNSYLKGHSSGQGQLAVPISFAEFNRRQGRVVFWIMAASVVLFGIGMYVYIATSFN